MKRKVHFDELKDNPNRPQQKFRYATFAINFSILMLNISKNSFYMSFLKESNKI